jgi:methylated-DNA-protein-cysteine methyltransferase-like protein
MTTPEDKLYLALSTIPTGKVISYGYLAELAGLPGRARWVGKTLSSLPDDTQLPWHRVVNASRRISFPADSEGYKTQRQRLESEGIGFSAAGTISKSNWIKPL